MGVELIGNSAYLTTPKEKKGRFEMNKWAVLSILSLIVALIFSIVLVIANYQINRDIMGWKTRAQVSSEPNDMHEYMSNVKEGMGRWGMTSGYAALIFQTPDNDMALIYRAVGQHVDQAKVLTGMDRSTPEYQTGLDNLRGSIRELDLHAFGFYSVHQGLVSWILCLLGWLLSIVIGLIWLES